jgi:pyruvate kinase
MAWVWYKGKTSQPTREDNHMRVKVVATLGPSSMHYEVMKALVGYGVRIFRLNFSHAEASYFVPVIKMVRELEHELDLPLTVMGDLCGPKIRIGDVEGSPRQVRKGDLVLLGLPDTAEADESRAFISLDFPKLLEGLVPGMPVSLSDGMLQFRVSRSITANRLYELEAQNSGILSSHKGIAFPGKFHSLPAMTEKDRKDLHEGLDIGIDAIALSFVQSVQDVVDLKNEISRHGTWIPVVSKLERKNALDDLDAILEASDAVMVARGDLGLECPLPELPVIQKKILRACRHAQKGSIVATQMLLSMVKNPIPTRAESTDVANAVMDGADCVMLSEETAIGDYPVDAVRFIHEIAKNAEEYYLERLQAPYAPRKEKHPGKYLAYAAALLADNAESKALVCHSTSGITARLFSSRRPAQPIYALTPDERVIRYLNFFWGIRPHRSEERFVDHLDRVEHFVKNSPLFQPGDNVVLTSGQPTPGQMETHTNQIKIFFK